MSVPPKNRPVTNGLHGSVSKIPRLLKDSDSGTSEAHSDGADAISANAAEVPSGATVQIVYTQLKVIGTGSFGVVYSATLLNNPTIQEVAIKKVLQDERYKNRELQILKSMQHTNVVALYYFFYSPSTSQPNETYLNLVQEFVPQTLNRLIKHYYRIRQIVPLSLVKLYSFQLLRGLAYIHHRNVCHRDIKPQNLLIDSEQGVLKICDFGSAKTLNASEPNVSYICSRYYRAPELIFGAVHYTVAIDMWSAGCVIGELLLGRPIFPGSSGVDQLVEVIKILGTPTREQVLEMNPQYCEFKFPSIIGHSWEKVIRHRTNEAAFALLRRMMVYTPKTRATSSEILADHFFADLIFPPPGHPPNATGHLPSGKPSPQFPTAFTDSELSYLPNNLVTRIQECKNAAACLPLSESTVGNGGGSITPTNYQRVRRVKSNTSRDQISASSRSQNQLIDLSTSASKPCARVARQASGTNQPRARSMLASSVVDMRSHVAASHSKSSNRLTDSTVDVDQTHRTSGPSTRLSFTGLSQSVHNDIEETTERSSHRSNRVTVAYSPRSMYSKQQNKSVHD